jgi:large subunit ribosomal protein L35
MPKLKTKSGVKKRFSLTATGKVKLADADTARVKLWAPYGLK